MTDQAQEILRQMLAEAETDFMISAPGVAAEFRRGPADRVIASDPAVLLLAVSSGALRIDPAARFRLFAYETVAARPDRWRHGLLLLLPAAEGAMAGRTVLTELGRDDEAILADDRGDKLFDLGLGIPHIDVCVRTGEQSLLELLRDHAGAAFDWFDKNLLAALLAHSPTRVFRSAVGRIEVFQGIPGPGERTPPGSHTHLLPKDMRPGEYGDANLPMGAGEALVMQVLPPNPIRDHDGAARPFCHRSHRAFQTLLKQFGDPAYVAIKDRTESMLQAGELPMPDEATALWCRAADVAVRQFEAQEGAGDLSDRFRSDIARARGPSIET